MRLRKLTANNIFSLGHVELDLDRKGLVLVTGHSEDEGGANGAGKSSLANKSILWCLFGQTSGGLRADDVVNRHTEPPYFAAIELEGTDGKLYTIKRSRKPASLELHCGDERLTQRNEKETQELIHTIIGRNYEIFLYSDFFGQGRGHNFLSVSPKEQKHILEKILPISQLTKWSDSAGKHRLKVRSDMDTIEKTVSFLRGGLDKIKSTKAQTLMQAAEWDKTQQQRIQQSETQIAEFKRYNSTALDTISHIEKTLDTLTIPPDESYKLKLAFDELLDARIKVGESKKSLDEWHKELAKWTYMYNNVNKEVCTMCNQRLPASVIDAELAGKLQAKDRIESIRITIEKAMAARDYYETLLVDKELEHNRYKSSVTAFNVAMQNRSNLIKELDNHKKTIGTDNLVRLESELAERRLQINPHIQGLENLDKQLVDETAKLEAAEKNLETLLLEENRLSFWQDAFGKDLKLYLFDRVCPFLIDRVSKHLEGLGNSQIKVTFSTIKQLKSGEERDEFCVWVSSRYGGDGFDNLSGGEQQIVSFAVGLALADLAESQAIGISRILILDEPFMSLDGRNAENLINYLVGALSTRRETILLISNEDALKTLVPTTIHITKQNGVSTLCPKN